MIYESKKYNISNVIAHREKFVEICNSYIMGNIKKKGKDYN